MANFAAVRAPPPSASFDNISAKNQATKPALEPNWAPGFDAYASAQASLLLASVFSIIPSSSWKLMMMV
jgi:hypothetical protein